MLLLGIDFETTFHTAETKAFDLTTMRVIEIGAVAWDTARSLPLVLSNLVLFDEDIAQKFDSRITDLTGLTLDDFKKYGIPPVRGFKRLTDLCADADYLVAHNGTNFDKPLFEHECARHGLEFPRTPWLDTSVDVPYPKKIETRKLEFLAPSHGFLNPFSHRAVFDVLSMLRVQSNYPIETIITRSTAQKVTLQAKTQKPWHDGGASNAAAKARGFRFDGDASKLWIKVVLADEVAAELAAPGLEVVVLK